jgi:asparagine synthase (glutamine-hydrolysing)
VPSRIVRGVPAGAVASLQQPVARTEPGNDAFAVSGNDLLKTVFRAPELDRTTNSASMRLIADGNPALSRIPTDFGLAGRKTLAEMMSYSWLRFTFRAEYAYDRGMPQWLAGTDHMLRPLHLERLFLGRHKPLHFRSWYRDQLSGYVREMLLDPKSLSRPYLERKKVQQIVEAHIAGTRNYTTEIHKLLKLEILHRHFVDHSAAAAYSPVPVAARY